MTVLKEGVVGGALNLFFIYKFLRILTTPWENTDAFKLGIIDGNGKILRKKSKLKTIEEKESYTMMHRLVWKLKRLMEKVPFGKSRLASYAAALWLIKEEKKFDGTDNELQESFLSFLETDWKNEALILKENYEGDMDKKTFGNLRQEGIDIKKASMGDVIKDFQSSDAPQFKGKSDKKKKEMAIAAKLSKEEFEDEGYGGTKKWKKGQNKMKKSGVTLNKKDKYSGYVEEIEVDEASLPPHLAKFFDKKGNLKPEVAARVAKGREKLNWKDVTPKGYGPKEEVAPHAKVMAKQGDSPEKIKKMHPEITDDELKSLFKEEVLEDGTNLIVQRYREVTPGEVDEKKVSKIKFKLKQFKHLKSKKKKKEHGPYSRFSDTSKGFSFMKRSDKSSGYVGAYNSTKFNGPEIKEARGYKPTPREVQDYLKWAKTQQGKGPKAVLKITDIEDWTMEIYKGIKAGWKSVSKSSLGGDENVAIMIKVTVEPEKEWPNKILQNASYGMIRIATDGTMEMFASGHKIKNMRKTKVKSARDVVSKINTWIKKVDEEVIQVNEHTGTKPHKHPHEDEEIEEKKSATGYELYHKDFSSAMQHAYDHAKKKGFVIDPKEIDDKVATGPKKPSSGKVNRYSLKAGRKRVEIQVTNLDNKRYELNMYIEGKEELSAFSKFITEGRPKQDKDFVPGATVKDFNRTGLRALADAQKKHYSSQDIKSIARKYKQRLVDAVGGKTWDWEWIITLANGMQLTYDYGLNSTFIKGWKFDKKKAAAHLAKYGNDHETVRDMQGGGGKVQVTGLETAFELISEGWKKGKYKVTDGKTGKVLGRFNSGGKAQKYVDDIFQKGDYEALTVELDEAVEIEEAFSMRPGDKKVVDAFYDQKTIKKHGASILTTDGKTLTKTGMGGQDIAKWVNGKIKIVAVSDVKSTEQILRYMKKSIPSGLFEDAPANSVAGGNVNLDPFVKKKRKNAKIQWEMFGGQKVFVVSPERFYDSRLGKARYARYEKYVGNDKLGEAIRQYGRNNPKNSIILKNSGNGAMLYLKYGRAQ